VEENGWERPADRPGFTFSDSVEWQNQVVDIKVVYAPQNWARWEYDAGAGSYVRYEGDSLHVEESTGEPLRAVNVVVLEAQHTTTDIDEGYGSFSVRIDLMGHGPALVFRDGLMAEGTWIRSGEMEMITILDEAGNTIPFKPGNVWVQVVPDVDIVETS
jgi:hypothetical protein